MSSVDQDLAKWHSLHFGGGVKVQLLFQNLKITYIQKFTEKYYYI